MTPSQELAPGAPGIEPRWTSSAKDGVGTAISTGSRVWFTLSHGILNEVYAPRIDVACTRDLGLVVTGDPDFFSEEKRDARHELETVAPGVPEYHLTNTCPQGRYRIEKTVYADPERDVVLQEVRFAALRPDLGPLRVHVLLAPHLGNRGLGNTGWVGDHKGVPMLFAEGHGRALALATDATWKARTVGFVGSDAWGDLRANRRLTRLHERAENGNVALAGELVPSADGAFCLALGFGSTAAEAGHQALASLRANRAETRARYRGEWEAWQAAVRVPGGDEGEGRACRISAMVLRTHESKGFPGGLIASLSIPWGSSKGDGDLGGYHLAWPRDLVESAGGLLALAAHDEVRRVLAFLRATQEADGHWPQNMWLDGTPYWNGVQMDETALPVLLVDLCLRKGALRRDELAGYWPMMRAALLYVLRNGPVTAQDRWEEDPGYSPYTLATEIAALLIGAEHAATLGETELRDTLLVTADAWNDAIETWTYVTDTALCTRFGVAGYYVRIAPPDSGPAVAKDAAVVALRNRPPGSDRVAAGNLVSTDALALVRFGLRAADDERIVNTLRVIDGLLRVELPGGPCFRRYNGDGYGEHEDGSPFDGTGMGRPWPLLTLERGHYELLAGHADEARELLQAAQAFANRGLLPEQVWNGPPRPDLELEPGRPAGSAMPLVWAHAEYVKLLRSLAEGAVFDMPPQPRARYARGRTASLQLWRFNSRVRWLRPGTDLRLETEQPATVRWSVDDWKTSRDQQTKEVLPGFHRLDLQTRELPVGSTVRFTFRWADPERWEGTDFQVTVQAP